MACRFALLSLLIFTALYCSDEASSQKAELKGTESTWDYKAQSFRGEAYSSWTDIPQMNNQVRLIYMCGFSKEEQEASSYLFLQFAKPSPLVTTPVKNYGNTGMVAHVAKSLIAWGHWDNLGDMESEPTDSVYLVLEGKEAQSRNMFYIRPQKQSKELEKHLQDRLRQLYGVAGVVLGFYEKDFKTHKKVVFIDLAGAKDALNVLSSSCSSN